MFNVFKFPCFPTFDKIATERTYLLQKEPEVDDEMREIVKLLKPMILKAIDNATANKTTAVIHTLDRKVLGQDYKSAEKASINQARIDEPYYESVCDALMADKDILGRLSSDERFESARFKVREQLGRDPVNSQYYSQLQISLDWTPKLRCSIL